MSSHVFNNLKRLLIKWPLDTTKQGRDLGEFIRKKVALGFPQGEATKVSNPEEWAKFIKHLENIADDRALKAHPRLHDSTATGLELEECKGIVSTTFLTYLEEENNRGLFSKKPEQQ